MTKKQFEKKYPDGMQFDVLGTKYTLRYNSKKCQSVDAVGLCEAYSKKIYLDISGFDNPDKYEDIEKHYMKVIRHELIHAFFFEMGLRDYFNDETLVDAVAIKFPQISKSLMAVTEEVG